MCKDLRSFRIVWDGNFKSSEEKIIYIWGNINGLWIKDHSLLQEKKPLHGFHFKDSIGRFLN